ncbi:MAG: adenylate kinase [Kiritimatiellia bacterium]|jgi:adenylate kinase
MMTIFVFLGAPGAGKGSVAGRIAEQGDATHVSTGNMLRDAVKNGTPAGRAAKAYMDQGALVPDAVLLDMISELLADAPADAVFLFDGFPRTENQAEQLESLVREHDATVAKAICLDVPEATILRRLGGRRVCPGCSKVYHVEGLPPKKAGVCDACGTALIVRDDDKPETIKRRLDVYAAQTRPLVDWYEKIGKLRHVDASGEVDVTVPLVKNAMAH